MSHRARLLAAAAALTIIAAQPAFSQPSAQAGAARGGGPDVVDRDPGHRDGNAAERAQHHLDNERRARQMADAARANGNEKMARRLEREAKIHHGRALNVLRGLKADGSKRGQAAKRAENLGDAYGRDAQRARSGEGGG